MEVQSVINESALKEARKYLIKPGIRKISAIASAAFVLLAAYCMLAGRPSTMLLAVFAIVIFYGELKMIESKQIKGFLKKLEELYGKTEVVAPIVFRDADILIQNPLSGGKNAVKYEVMDTLIEYKNVIKSLDLVELNPLNDIDNKTYKIAKNLLDMYIENK